MNTTKPFDCPVCGDEVLVDVANPPKRIPCPECSAVHHLDLDAETDNGEWRDLSKLVVIMPEVSALKFIAELGKDWAESIPAIGPANDRRVKSVADAAAWLEANANRLVD